MNMRNTLLLLGMAWGFSSCELINPDEGIPSYIQVDSISLSTDATIQGSNSQNISDAWIYVDGMLITAAELPCRIPVLKEGSHDVLIGPGIKINGLSAYRAPYPFYRFYSTTVNLSPGETVKLSPSTTYFDSLSFPFLANFDDLSGNKFEATSASDSEGSVALTTNPAEVREGAGSLKAYLDVDSGSVEFHTVETLDLPKLGTLLYLEIDYKCTHDLQVELISSYNLAGDETTPLLTIYPTETWKKMYINLTKAVSERTTALNYRILFRSTKTEGDTPLSVWLDNVKIVY